MDRAAPARIGVRSDAARPGAGHYDAGAAVATALDHGEDVAFLCQGDPLFYGSFAGILTRLAPAVAIIARRVVIDRLRRRRRDPLVQRDEFLAVIRRPCTGPNWPGALAIPTASRSSS